MGERIVLFGGTFNPIHHGHLIVARAVAEHFHFDRVTFVPAAISPHKTALAGQAAPQPPEPAAEDRLEMIRLAIAGEDLFDVTDMELKRRPPSYTLDTLMAFRQEHGLDVPLYWIIGADMLEDLPTWRRVSEVVDMATILTASRPPYTARLERTLQALRVRLSDQQVARLASGIVATPLVDISSTQIRHRIRARRSARYLTPDIVIDYINRRGLYRNPPREN